MPVVLNKRVHGVPKGAVYVGRPSKFGNPFVVGRDGDRDEVIAKFVDFINESDDLQQQARVQLAGRDLVCWCAPQPCHADVLLQIANV